MLVNCANNIKYLKDRKKVDFDDGENLLQWSKKCCCSYFLSDCQDLCDEILDFEHLAKDLSNSTNNSSDLFTPKLHCEMSGEGIEYSWVVARRFCQQYSLKSKKAFQQFINCVKQSLKKVLIDICY